MRLLNESDNINKVNESLDSIKESKNPLKSAARRHRRKQKGLSPFGYLNPNAGNVEHNVAFFNMAMGSGDATSTGGGEGMGEDLDTAHGSNFKVIKYNKYLYAVLDKAKNILVRKPEYINDPEAYKYAYDSKGKAYFFTTKDKNEAEAYANDLQMDYDAALNEAFKGNINDVTDYLDLIRKQIPGIKLKDLPDYEIHIKDALEMSVTPKQIKQAIKNTRYADELGKALYDLMDKKKYKQKYRESMKVKHVKTKLTEAEMSIDDKRDSDIIRSILKKLSHPAAYRFPFKPEQIEVIKKYDLDVPYDEEGKYIGYNSWGEIIKNPYSSYMTDKSFSSNPKANLADQARKKSQRALDNTMSVADFEYDTRYHSNPKKTHLELQRDVLNHIDKEKTKLNFEFIKAKNKLDMLRDKYNYSKEKLLDYIDNNFENMFYKDNIKNKLIDYINTGNIQLESSSSNFKSKNNMKEEFRIWDEEDIENNNALAAASKAIIKFLDNNEIKYEAVDFDVQDFEGNILVIEPEGDIEEVAEMLEDEFGFSYEIQDDIIYLDATEEYEDADGNILKRVTRQYMNESLDLESSIYKYSDRLSFRYAEDGEWNTILDNKIVDTWHFDDKDSENHFIKAFKSIGLGQSEYEQWRNKLMLREDLSKENSQGYTLDSKLYDYFKATNPNDPFADDIDKEATFRDLFNAINDNADVYEVIFGDENSGDSVVREELFNGLAEILDINYDNVYYAWLGHHPLLESNNTINIRKELNRLDSEEYRDLLNMYDSIDLSNHEKQRIAELISKNKIDELADYLEELYYVYINVYDGNGNGIVTNDLGTFYKHDDLLDDGKFYKHESLDNRMSEEENLKSDLLSIPYVTNVKFETYDKDLNYTDNWNEIFQLIALIDVDIDYADIDFVDYLKEKSKLRDAIKNTFKKHGFKYQDPPEYNGSYYYLVLEKENLRR